MRKNKKLESLLGEMREFAREHHIPISTAESIKTIERLLQSYKPKHCLEIGTCIGYGTIEIARRIEQWGGDITSYEISLPSFISAQGYRKASGLSNIELIFQDILKTFDVPPSTFEFIYIDAQKSKYLDFLIHVLPLASENAIILFDDVLAFPEKTKEFWRRIQVHKVVYELIPHQDGDGMLVLKRSRC